MRGYDNTDSPLHHKAQFNTRQILDNMLRDALDLLSAARDPLLYFLRIAILICGYIVVRPVIEACFRKFMAPANQSPNKKQKQNKSERLPGQKSLADELLLDSDDASDNVDTSNTAEWGGALRRRRKARFMEVWEEEQARLAEEEELRELEDILED
jgi:hypothetical protein